MYLVNADFHELYRRHLCRHSEFGINVLHLVAVAGIYLALFGIALAGPGGEWIVGIALTAYFAILAKNLPIQLWVVNTAVILVLLAVILALPVLPIWAYALFIVVLHQFQNWNHKLFHKHHDMEEFKEKYKKGPALFLLLSVYELPILLNYLVFDRRSWTA